LVPFLPLSFNSFSTSSMAEAMLEARKIWSLGI
jgi:hypothetical protein